MSLQLTAFAYKDYLHFGYVDQGLSETVNLQKQFNINTYAPTMLVFKESTDKPADIIQAHFAAVLVFLPPPPPPSSVYHSALPSVLSAG